MTSLVKAGDRIPSVSLKLVEASGTTDTTADAVLGNGRFVLFAVPGAFTPTCNTNHLPGFLANADRIREAGIDRIFCVAVNDHHVMRAWAVASEAFGKIDFLADGNGLLARALGLDKDMTGSGMGVRYVRSAMIVRNGVVEAAFIEDAPGQVTGSGAPAIVMALQASAA